MEFLLICYSRTQLQHCSHQVHQKSILTCSLTSKREPRTLYTIQHINSQSFSCTGAKKKENHLGRTPKEDRDWKYATIFLDPYLYSRLPSTKLSIEIIFDYSHHFFNIDRDVVQFALVLAFIFTQIANSMSYHKTDERVLERYETTSD
jgi:hypothetical protein